MDKGLTAQKWVLINKPKIPQMPQNISAQFVCSSPKVLDFNEKKASLHWSVVRGIVHSSQIARTDFITFLLAKQDLTNAFKND